MNQPGGFSPGVAARSELADGRRCFIKAVSPAQNPRSPDMHRREGQVTRVLPAELPVPELIEVIDDGEWVVLIFSEIDGQPPALPWSFEDLESTFRALDDLAARTTPCPVAGLSDVDVRFATTFDGYRLLAAGDPAVERIDGWSRKHLDRLAAIEEQWPEAAAGNTLVHSDIRADNLLVRADGTVVIVDWPHACVGAAWLDKTFMLPSVALDGGPSPLEVERVLRPLNGVAQEAVDCLVVALSGYFTLRGAQSDPPGLPTVRSFQRAQGRVARAWAAHRLQLLD